MHQETDVHQAFLQTSSKKKISSRHELTLPGSGGNGRASQAGQKNVRFLSLEYIFAVFLLVLVTRKNFGAPRSVFRGVLGVFGGICSTSEKYPQRVWRAPKAFLEGTHSLFPGISPAHLWGLRNVFPGIPQHVSSLFTRMSKSGFLRRDISNIKCGCESF